MASFGPESQYSCKVLSFLLGGSHYSLLSQYVYKAGQTGTGPGRRTLCLARFVLQDGYSSNGKYWVLSPVWCDPYASAVQQWADNTDPLVDFVERECMGIDVPHRLRDENQWRHKEVIHSKQETISVIFTHPSPNPSTLQNIVWQYNVTDLI